MSLPQRCDECVRRSPSCEGCRAAANAYSSARYRRLHPEAKRPGWATRSCAYCGSDFKSVTLSAGRGRTRCCSKSCAKRLKDGTPRSADDRRSKRYARELATPGLTRHHRERLLERWVAEGRRCSYCSRPADTVDHVVPLQRGGTNAEVNLVPCCRPCNSSKGVRLLEEWRAVA